MSAAHYTELLSFHHCGLLYASGPTISALSGTYSAPSSPASQLGLKIYFHPRGQILFRDRDDVVERHLELGRRGMRL
ncbi:MAG: hypothetical protein JXA30_16830 [Deltaproteobacteria bacterium]|nr:hypothetical protein [Deltaproteobacteria bacterium]